MTKPPAAPPPAEPAMYGELAELFSRQDWLGTLADVGFHAKVVPFEHSEIEPGTVELFVAERP